VVLIAALIALLPLLLGGCTNLTNMPGTSYSGALPAATPAEIELQNNIRRHVRILAGEIGERNRARPSAYLQAADYIEESFRQSGYVPKRLQERRVGNLAVHNIEAELPGTNFPNETLVVGAHYDSEKDCPGANDNGSGVAALLEIARLCAGHRMARTIRFVAFYDEEDFGQRPMGSQLFAAEARRRHENVTGMISLETIGYYSDAPKSQHYPLPFRLLFRGFPKTGDFVAFVGNSASRDFLRQSVASFRHHAKFPSQALVAPWLISDAGRSDQVGFWEKGFPGLMITDTANFRYRYYHEREDTPDKLDYDRTARVVEGLAGMIQDLGRAVTFE